MILADFVTRETVEAVTCWGIQLNCRHCPVSNTRHSAIHREEYPDAMTLAIGHLQSDATCVLDMVLELKRPFDPERAV